MGGGISNSGFSSMAMAGCGEALETLSLACKFLIISRRLLHSLHACVPSPVFNFNLPELIPSLWWNCTDFSQEVTDFAIGCLSGDGNCGQRLTALHLGSE